MQGRRGRKSPLLGISKEKIGFSEVSEVLDYDGDTGQFKWKPQPAGHYQKDGYLIIGVGPHAFKAHRLAWLLHYGEWPKGQIDHINGDPADNRIENLREVSPSENAMNRGMRSDNTSGYKGVFRFKNLNKWGGRVSYKGANGLINVHAGVFPSKEEAHKAVEELRKKLHREFSRTK